MFVKLLFGFFCGCRPFVTGLSHISPLFSYECVIFCVRYDYYNDNYMYVVRTFLHSCSICMNKHCLNVINAYSNFQCRFIWLQYTLKMGIVILQWIFPYIWNGLTYASCCKLWQCFIRNMDWNYLLYCAISILFPLFLTDSVVYSPKPEIIDNIPFVVNATFL